MSTAGQNFTDNFTDSHAPHLPPAKKKVQTPYKPRLSIMVKRSMEDCVKDALEAQQLMEQMLAWLEHETCTVDAIRQEIATLPTPLDYRMAALLERETEALIRIGKLELILARMALTVTRLERRLEQSLANAREASPAGAERKRKVEENGGGGRQQ